MVGFIGKDLPPLRVNTLILEFNFGYNFRSRPEFTNAAAAGLDEARQIARACQEQGIELIPQLNCLGHQSWAKQTDRLLTLHPEFDETPGKYPGNTNIYCRSYCPLHPGVHAVLFDLIDELASACAAKSFHLGMDEVFLLADPDCPRCRGKDPADLLAGEVTRLRDHLKTIGCRPWMWGDRFIDGKATGIGEWEASLNGTHPAIDRVPQDVVICDWHYENAPPTPRFFAGKGFAVVACPWRKPAVALQQLGQIRELRAASDASLAARGLGVVQTTWCGSSAFIKAFRAQTSGQAPGKDGAGESAACFRTLAKAWSE